jgi:uncharacterized protein (DUF169 family)
MARVLFWARRVFSVLLRQQIFGFRPLTSGLQSGKALVGFGIVADEEVGRQMFANMTKLKFGEIQQLQLFPLERAEDIPDIIVVEDEVGKLMWIVLSFLHATGGERVRSSTAVLQATCVDSTSPVWKSS